MTDKQLLAECEREFDRILDALEFTDYKAAKTYAWRMKQRIEEARLRHPY